MRRAWACVLAIVALVVSAPRVLADPLDLVGAYDPGTGGLNASAIGLDGIAYLGSWGSAADCPGLGVRILDVSDPAAPNPIGTAAAYDGTTAEHLAAVHFTTSAFTGSVLFAGIQRCNASGGAPGGLAIWDVTDPSNPSELGFLPTGRGPRGVHEFTVRQRGDRWFAYLAVWNSEITNHSVALAHDGKLALVADETFGPPWGRLRLVDVQDPGNPVQVGSFDTPDSAAGTPGEQYAYTIHNPLADDRDPNRAYLAWYSDGIRLLDVADASRPVELANWIPPGGGMVWNVSFMGDLLLAGDINRGLCVLRR